MNKTKPKLLSKIILFVALPLAVLAGVLAFSGVASAADYYVSTAGIDTNTGLSEAQAWKTIQYAANSISAGDTVYVLAGTYNEKVTISRSGIAGSSITFQGEGMPTITYTGNVPITISGSYITIDGFRIIANDTTYDVDHVSGISVTYDSGAINLNISNNYIKTQSGYGILTARNSANNSIISNNEIHTGHYAGICIVPQNSITENVTITNNTFYVDENALHRDSTAASGIFGYWQTNPPAFRNFTITYNKILHSGYTAIKMPGSGHKINYNEIGPNGYVHNAIESTMTDGEIIGNRIYDTNLSWALYTNAIYPAGLGEYKNLIIRDNIVENSSGRALQTGGDQHDVLIENFTANVFNGYGIAIIAYEDSRIPLPVYSSNNLMFVNTNLINFYSTTESPIIVISSGTRLPDGTWARDDNTFINPKITGTYTRPTWWLTNNVGYEVNHHFDGTVYVINSNKDDVLMTKVAWNPDATFDGEIIFYYYIDVQVVDTNGNPVDRAKVSFTASDVAMKAKNLNYTYEPFPGKTQDIDHTYTGFDGHTSLPSDAASTVAIADFKQTITGKTYYTWTVTAEKDGHTNSITVNPDSAWYRLTPDTYQNTTTIVLDISTIPTVSTPAFSPVQGTYASTQTVSISTATADAIIHHTTNGTDPTESSSIYSSPMQVSSTTIVKARAYKSGSTPSSIATATYTIATPILTSIDISPTSATVQTGNTQTFIATPKDQFGNAMTGITITWSSSNTGVTTINSSGVATGVVTGTSIITAVSGSISGTAALTVADQPAGLVSYWKFDETSGTTASDSSGNNNNGTLINGPAWTTGKIGNALQFDGANDYMDAGSGSNLNITGAKTLSLWIKPSSSAIDKRIIAAPSGFSEPYIIIQHNLQISIADGTLLSDAKTTTGNVLSTSAWTHIAVVYNGADITAAKVYANGVQQTLGNPPWVYGVPAGNLRIGSRQDNLGFFPGSIDEVRIYSRALTASEILAEYNAGNTPTDITLPSISISSPTNNQTFTNPSITATGTASDNIALSKVEVKLNSGSYQTAIGTTSWSIPLTLISGTNTITAKATDTSNNIKETSIAVTYILPNTTPTPPSGGGGASLDSAPPVISNISSSFIAANSAIISWDTNELSNSQIEYGLSSSYGFQTNLFPNLINYHVVKLSNLSSTINYHYRVISIDSSGNKAVSGDKTFTTLAGGNPDLNNIPIPPPATSYPEGTLLKTTESFKVYVIINQKKKWISTPEVFETLGYKWTAITIVDKTDLDKISDYEDNLIRAVNDYKVYLVTNGISRHIPNPEIFLDYGFVWDDVKDVPQETINQYSRGYLIRESRQGTIYYLSNNGIKKWIPNPEIFSSYNNRWEDIQVVSKKEMESYPVSNLRRYNNQIFLIENNVKRLIPNEVVLNRYDTSLILDVNKNEFEWWKTGSVVW